MENYDKWLVETNQEIVENSKSLSLPVIVCWIMEAWNEITSDVIKKSFKTCALNLSPDESENHLIHYFKNGQPYKSGKETLASQLPILSEKDENPFIDMDDEDIEMAVPVFISVGSDQEDDEDRNLLNIARRKLRNIERFIVSSFSFLFICEGFNQNF